MHESPTYEFHHNLSSDCATTTRLHHRWPSCLHYPQDLLIPQKLTFLVSGGLGGILSREMFKDPALFYIRLWHASCPSYFGRGTGYFQDSTFSLLSSSVSEGDWEREANHDCSTVGQNVFLSCFVFFICIKGTNNHKPYIYDYMHLHVIELWGTSRLT